MVFLIDYENRHNLAFLGSEYLNTDDVVIIFFSQCCTTIQNGHMKRILDSGCCLEQIKLKTAGKNYLDFYIAVKVGEILSEGREEHIAIISGDRGFTAVRDYCKAYGKMEYPLVQADDIEQAILAAQELDERFFKIKEFKQMISMEIEFAKHQENLRLKEELRSLFEGTEDEELMSEVFEIVSGTKGRKNAYTRMLKTFGREQGGRVYRRVRELTA